jgi:hypothetical protein
MKLFGSLKELVSAVFRKNSQQITLRPNQTTTYTASRDVQLPPQDADGVLVSANSSQTLINKTIDGDDNTVQDLALTSLKTVLADADKVLRRNSSGVVISGNALPNNSQLVTTDAGQTLTSKTLTSPTINTPSITGASLLSLDDSDSTFNLALASTSTLTTDRTLTIDVDDGNRTLELSGNFRTLGGNTLSLTTTLATNVTLPSTGTLATLANSEQFTNKDIDGGTASNTSRLTLPKASTSTLSGLTRKQGTLVYDTTIDKPYYDNGSSLISLVSSSSGSGEVNAVLNPNAADDTTGYTAATNYTVAKDTSNSPLSPATSTSLSMTTTTASSESSTSGIYYSISTMPAGLKNRKLKVEFYATIPATSAGVWRLSVYSGSTRMALSTDSSSVTTLPGGVTGKFTAYFDADSSSSYTVNFTQTTRTSSNTMYVTGLIVGPGIQPQGAAVGETQYGVYSLTFSAGFGTTSLPILAVTREGNIAKFRGSIKTGTTAASTASFTLPSGFTIDSSKFSSTANFQQVGFSRNLANTDSVWTTTDNNVIFYDGSTTNTLYLCQTMTTNAYQKQNGNTILLNNNVMDFYFEIPVSEWSGSGTVAIAQNDVEYAYNTSTSDAADTTSFGYGPAGTAFPSSALTANRKKRVRFQTPILATDKIVMEVQTSSSGAWQELVSDSIPTANGAAAGPSQLVQQNSVDYGAGIDPTSVNSTDVDVILARYAFNASTYGASGAAWNATSGGYKWRLRKISQGSAVGFGLATTTSSGLVNPYTQGSGVVYAGTFTSAASNTVNLDTVDIASYPINYMRVGNVVTMSGLVDVNATTGGGTTTSFDFTVPVASSSNFTAAQVSGSGQRGDASGAENFNIRYVSGGSSTKIQMKWQASATGTITAYWTASYSIS